LTRFPSRPSPVQPLATDRAPAHGRHGRARRRRVQAPAPIRLFDLDAESRESEHRLWRAHRFLDEGRRSSRCPWRRVVGPARADAGCRAWRRWIECRSPEPSVARPPHALRDEFWCRQWCRLSSGDLSQCALGIRCTVCGCGHWRTRACFPAGDGDVLSPTHRIRTCASGHDACCLTSHEAIACERGHAKTGGCRQAEFGQDDADGAGCDAARRRECRTSRRGATRVVYGRHRLRV